MKDITMLSHFSISWEEITHHLAWFSGHLLSTWSFLRSTGPAMGGRASAWCLESAWGGREGGEEEAGGIEGRRKEEEDDCGKDF